MIQAKLPRELRDMVYGYLTTFSQVYVKLPANGKGMYVSPSIEGSHSNYPYKELFYNDAPWRHLAMKL
jgi:hypothetical protein